MLSIIYSLTATRLSRNSSLLRFPSHSHFFSYFLFSCTIDMLDWKSKDIHRILTIFIELMLRKIFNVFQSKLRNIFRMCTKVRNFNQNSFIIWTQENENLMRCFIFEFIVQYLVSQHTYIHTHSTVDKMLIWLWRTEVHIFLNDRQFWPWVS